MDIDTILYEPIKTRSGSVEFDVYMDVIDEFQKVLEKAKSAYAALPSNLARWTYSPIEIMNRTD